MRFTLLGIFGVLPALVLGCFAAFGVWSGLKIIVIEPRWFALVLCIWGSAGIWGAVSITRAAIGDVSATIRFGLYAGMIAVIPVVITMALDPGLADSPVLFVVSIAPFLTACYLIAELHRAGTRDELRE